MTTGTDPEGACPRTSGDTELTAYLETFGSTDEEYVDAVYRLALRRDPEPDARQRALAKLAEGTLSRATLLHELVTPESTSASGCSTTRSRSRSRRGRGESGRDC